VRGGYFYLATSGYLELATRGYFFMATDMGRHYGLTVARCTVVRLMRELAISGARRVGKSEKWRTHVPR
jgi:hypothetical protein